jgi:hypothetical protein
VTTSRRQTATIEFTPPEYDRVAMSLAQLCVAGSGWMNLLPGIDEDAVDIVPPSGLSAFFGSRQPPVTMATIMPPRLDRRSDEGMTVGLMHPTGAKAVPRLAETGITVPEGWVVRQDHVRRGLVVRTRVDEPEPAVIAWCVRAGTALCKAEMTGAWQAVVYLP